MEEAQEMERFRNFLEGESGSTTMEYVLLIVMIGLGCIAAIESISGALRP